MNYQKPNLFYYKLAQAAYDFVNLIGACKRPMSFVISNSFYQSLPIKGILDKLAVIPKQQFQTTTTDLKKIRAVIQAGESVVIYPAGLMCEDGLSTPIPTATYKLFKWLGVDVYMAKTCGTYFAMPKWTTGFRPGKTTLDIYKLFSKDELETLDADTIRQKTQQALPFSPGKYMEIQDGQNIYRCVLEDGKPVMKFINMVKAFHEIKGSKQGEEYAIQNYCK